jgi:CHAT domain-containing protein/Tfp pilus assembly protein PilF
MKHCLAVACLPPFPATFLLLACWLVLADCALSAQPTDKDPATGQKERLDQRDKLKAESHKLAAASKLAEALLQANKALDIEREILGDLHEDVAGSLQWLADLREARTEWAAARQARQEVLTIQTKLHGAGDWRVTDARLALAETERRAALTAEQRRRLSEALRLHRQLVQAINRRQEAEAIPLGQQSLDIRKEILGPDHRLVADSLNNLGLLHLRLKDRAAALPLLRQALAIREKVLGKDHPAVGDSLHNLGILYKGMGKEQEAEASYRQALEVRQKAFGPTDNRTLATLIDLAPLYRDRGEYGKAEPLYRLIVEARRKSAGEKSLAFANSLSDLAWAYNYLGNGRQAAPLFLQALEIYREQRGQNHADVAKTLNDMAGVHQRLGEFAQAQTLYRQALAIFKETLGEQSSKHADSLSGLASLFADTGDYGNAEALYKQAKEIRRQVLGEKSLRFADSLNNLAILYLGLGKHTEAEPLFRQALEIVKEKFGARHPHCANALNNLAVLYQGLGDFAQAESFLNQALDIQAGTVGERHPSYALTLNSLAGAYQRQGDHARAEPLLRRALEIFRQALGEKHPLYADSLNNLALACQAAGHNAQAEELLRQALQARKAAVGEKHPDYAASLLNLAAICRARGENDEALSLLKEGLKTYGQALGEDHPLYATGLNSLAGLYRDKDDPRSAEPIGRQALQILSRHVRLVSAIQSERQQLAMLRAFRTYLDEYLSLSPEKAGITAEEDYAPVLSWKGMVFARQRQLREARRLLEKGGDAQARSVYQKLEEVSRQLATVALAQPGSAIRPGRREKLAELTRQREDLEKELARQSADFRRGQELAQLTPAMLQKALPKGTALVDFLEYQHASRSAGNKGSWLYERRLLAFVVRPDRPIERIDLRLAASVTRAVEAWRERELQGQRAKDASPGAELRRLIWEPLEAKLEGAQTVLISPDGALGRFPFAALPGRKPGTYMIEERAVAVAPVPQLLPEWLGRPEEAKGRPALLALGNVDYGATAGAAIVGSRAAPTVGGVNDWAALPWTGVEIRQIEQLFQKTYPGAAARLLEGPAATEGAVRIEAPGSRFLHLATHGFFAPPRLRSALAAAAGQAGPRGPDLFSQGGISGAHPGLLSGLVLAGANHKAGPDQDDGILTGLEVAALDLGEVEVAVLSACETGLGKETAGEGLLGLQRAFQVAGARSVVASLWQVDDKATQRLMTLFYDNLWLKKLSRLEALRQAQLALLKGTDGEGQGRGPDMAQTKVTESEVRAPPRLWAAWILSGDPGPASQLHIIPSQPEPLPIAVAPAEVALAAEAEPERISWFIYAGGGLALLVVLLLALAVGIRVWGSWESHR